jgi:hypothetical protein
MAIILRIYTCERLKIPTAFAVGQRKQVLPARVYVKSNARRYKSTLAVLKGWRIIMDIMEKLHQQFGELVSLEEVSDGVMRIYAPFFHEDGDMLSMYLQRKPDGGFLIRDYGNALMRVSYTFDLDTENKRNVLTNIVKSNCGQLDDTELLIETDFNTLPQSIFQFSQLVAKVSNIDLLQRQVVRSLFYDYLNEFISVNFFNYKIKRNAMPTEDRELIVDYRFDAARPLFVFGVNGDVKASKVIISCLSFQKSKRG